MSRVLVMTIKNLLIDLLLKVYWETSCRQDVISTDDHMINIIKRNLGREFHCLNLFV